MALTPPDFRLRDRVPSDVAGCRPVGNDGDRRRYAVRAVLQCIQLPGAPRRRHGSRTLTDNREACRHRLHCDWLRDSSFTPGKPWECQLARPCLNRAFAFFLFVTAIKMLVL